MKTKSTSERLRSLLAERAVVLGPVTLSHGGESDHYFDCKKVTLSSEGSDLVGDAVLDAIQSLPEMPAAIGGLTIGADPIISAVMMRARERGIFLNGFYVRQKPKEHGTKKLIENAPPKGTKVVIVDDVVTRGGSVLTAVEVAEREGGCVVLAVITLVDRLEGGGDKIREKVKQYKPLYTLNDFPELQKCQKNTTKSERLSVGVSR